MLFWIVSGTIVVAVTAILAGAVRAGRRADEMTAKASDIAVYRDQLAEVERDLARGVLTEAEAEAVRVEVSRRLLDADKRQSESSDDGSKGNAAIGGLIIFAVVLLGGLGIYSAIGAPGYPDQPLDDRIARLEDLRDSRPSQDEAENAAMAAGILPRPPEPQSEFLELMERLRTTVAERPDDQVGLRLLAQNEARLGNFRAARQAQGNLVASFGESAPVDERLALLEIMVFAAGGIVSPEAEAVLADIETRAPEIGEVAYYRGLIETQNGRPDIAFPIWRRLLETSSPGDPWVPVIQSEIRRVAAAAGIDYSPPEVRGPSTADIAAAQDMTEEERREMIEGMVAGLADRLATDGGPPADWARLIRALGVLGQAERAAQIGTEAEDAFSGNEDALRIIRSATRDVVRQAGEATE